MKYPDFKALAYDTTQRQSFPPRQIEVVAMTHSQADLRLLHALHQQALAEDKDKFLQPKEGDYFQSLLLCNRCEIFIVKVDGKPAGKVCVVLADNYVAAKQDGHITYTKPDTNLRQEFAEGRVAVIQSLCVLNAFRGVGLGKLLIDRAINHVQSHGVRHIFAQTKQHNPKALSLFQSFGFQRRATWRKEAGRYLLYCRVPVRGLAKRLPVQIKQSHQSQSLAS